MTTDRHGELSIDGDRATMTFRRRLPHPIEAVWAALTEPVERKAWFGETTIDARTGGSIEMMPDEPPAAPDAKRLTFTHTGLSPTNARGFLPGTHAFLDRLDAHLSNTTLPHWSTRYEELASSYPAWT